MKLSQAIWLLRILNDTHGDIDLDVAYTRWSESIQADTVEYAPVTGFSFTENSVCVCAAESSNT